MWQTIALQAFCKRAISISISISNGRSSSNENEYKCECECDGRVCVCDWVYVCASVYPTREPKPFIIKLNASMLNQCQFTKQLSIIIIANGPLAHSFFALIPFTLPLAILFSHAYYSAERCLARENVTQLMRIRLEFLILTSIKMNWWFVILSSFFWRIRFHGILTFISFSEH